MAGYFIETGALSELSGEARIVTIKVNIADSLELHHHDPSSGSGWSYRRDRQTDPSAVTSHSQLPHCLLPVQSLNI